VVSYSFDLIVMVVFFLVQWRITHLLLRSSARRWKGIRRGLAWAAIFVMDLLLLIGYLLSFSFLNGYVSLPRRTSAYLEGAALGYLVIASGAMILWQVLRFLVTRWKSDETDPGRRRLLRVASQAAVVAPTALMGYGTFIQRLDFRVREVEIPFSGLPNDLDRLRILQISDIHRGPFLSDADLGRVIDAALGLRPHLAVVTGDLITSYGDPLDACIRQVGRLRADAGVFGCMGNHERYVGAEKHTAQASAALGVRFLRSASQPLRFGSATLNLAGVDYQKKGDAPGYLAGAERLLAPGAFNILLSHNPDVFPVAARQGYNLLLAGHTHGGQVTVEILDNSINPARFFTPYVYGVYRSGDAAAYVTRGVGTIGLPTRIGAPPEISLLQLRKA
jgi:predicted MPP superfamily phosphohydrolase